MYEIRAGVQTFENVLIMAACLLIRTDRWRMIMSKSLELQIVSECAPTLAGIKTANLFNYKYSDKEAFILELDSANEELNRLSEAVTQAHLYMYIEGTSYSKTLIKTKCGIYSQTMDIL